MKIAVGSTHPVKMQTVVDVAERAFPGAVVESVAVPSGVPDQPQGDAQARAGAFLDPELFGDGE